jgi:hypothetical protein
MEAESQHQQIANDHCGKQMLQLLHPLFLLA